MSTLDFGNYCTIEQKRYGCDNEFYKYKVVGRVMSNCYREVPIDGRQRDNVTVRGVYKCIRVILCGVCEDTIETVRVKDVQVGYKGNF